MCGQGKFPYYYNFNTLSTTPKASPTLSVPVMTGALITLSWTTFTDGNSTGGSPITGYSLYWNNTGTSAVLATISGASTLSYSLTNVSSPSIPYTKYLAFTILATNANGNGPQSAAYVIQTPTTPS